MSRPQQLKLPQRLKHEFDRMILQSFRDLEKIERKISAFRNHLHFTLHCKHHGVFPPSLTLKCSMKGKGVNTILLKAQRALLNERVTRIKRELDHFTRKRTDLDERLFTQLPSDVYEEVGQWMAHARTTEFDNIRQRQKQKFEHILAKSKRAGTQDTTIVNVNKQDKDDLQSKWVVNLSDRVLTPHETSLLKKGLNFAVAPTSIPVNDYIIGIESACNLLGPNSQQAQTLRADCVKIIKHASPPKPNITAKEKLSLRSLAKDPDIMILPADKGRAVVVLNAQDYKAKAKALLSDRKTYQPLSKDPTAKYTAKLIKKLKELKDSDAISDIEYRRLYPTSTMIPRFYGLPKVHKAGAPLRPIVASRGSLTYAVARRVADILAPLVGKNSFALKNSADLVKQLGGCKLDETDILVSFDVTALFTCVPVDKSLDVIFDKVARDTTLSARTKLSPTQVRDLLAICLKTTYFLYDGVIYSQVEGAAMGSPVSPIVANLFMEWFEEAAIRTFRYEITIWRRYVDDTMVALCNSLLEDFTGHINSIDPAIKFTREEEEDGRIAMLDAKIRRDNSGSLSFTVYRKPTHTDQYLQFSSNQPLQHKLGVIRTLYHRCNTICSSEEAKSEEIEHLKG